MNSKKEMLREQRLFLHLKIQRQILIDKKTQPFYTFNKKIHTFTFQLDVKTLFLLYKSQKPKE